MSDLSNVEHQKLIKLWNIEVYFTIKYSTYNNNKTLKTIIFGFRFLTKKM